MHFFPEALEQYAVAHTKSASEVLQQLERETYTRIYMPQMVSGHLQGKFLSMISRMVKPENILEIGTFTGYSAICLSDGLQENGTLYTIDVNEELEEMARKYFAQAGLTHKVKYMIGDAVSLIPQIEVMLDLVFIDADKENYSKYYDLVFPKLRSGGVILADNVLWSGKVIEEKMDAETKALTAFNDKVQSDPRVDNVLITIRDGVMMMIKK